MALTVNGTAMKKCNVQGSRCKQVNLNGTKIWTDEENWFPEKYSQWKIGGNQNGNGRSEYTINSSQIHLLSDLGYENGDYSNATKAWAYTPLIDFSQYKKLTITFSYLVTGTQYWTHATAKIGILNSTQVVVYNNNGCTEQGANNWSWEQSFVTSGSADFDRNQTYYINTFGKYNFSEAMYNDLDLRLENILSKIASAEKDLSSVYWTDV